MPLPRQQGRVRLAVLPLQNLSGDPGQDYFVDGMHVVLITDVARLRGLRVIARSSVLGYAGTNRALPLIAEQLKVDVVLTGSVMRVGDRVRITAQLLSGPTKNISGLGDTTATCVTSSPFRTKSLPRSRAKFTCTRAKSVFVKPYLIAILYDHSGDIQRALEWFERAFEARDHDMIYFNIAPTTSRLRATSHFRELVQRMNLPLV